MNTRSILGATVLALAFSTGGAFAHPHDDGEHGARGHGMHGAPDRHRQMMNHLNLTDDQKEQIRQIHERYRPQFQQLQQQVQAEVRTVLTEEQRAQMDERRGNRGERRRSQRSN